MAALDFPDNPTNGQVFDKWTWNGTMWVLTASGSGGGGSGFTFNQDAVPTATRIGDTWYETDTGDSFVWTNDGNSTQWVQFAPGSGGGGGSGFTYVTDTKPTPSKVGDTWFDLSTAATGGTSWVAIEEAPGGEKVWVQFAPGAGAPPLGPMFRRFVVSSTVVTVSTTTVIPFADSVNDFIGGIGNRTSGVFSLAEKGLFSVDIALVWSGSFGSPGMTVDLSSSDNQGAWATCGSQPAYSPFLSTENSFLLDHTQTNLGVREYGFRIYNYVATMTITSGQIRVARVSPRP